jgi:hypothetical protein
MRERLYEKGGSVAGFLTRLWFLSAAVCALTTTTTALAFATTSPVEPATSAPEVVAGPRVPSGSDPVPLGGEDSKATCPPDTRLIGGGYKLFILIRRDSEGVPHPEGIVTTNAPSITDPNTWAAGSQGAAEIQAFALCETGT